MPWAEHSARAAARIRSLVAAALRMGRSFLFSFYHLTNRLARSYDETNRLVSTVQRCNRSTDQWKAGRSSAVSERSNPMNEASLGGRFTFPGTSLTVHRIR